jgi:hypothetical protein|nr:MAG TPA: hypothetical protein [Microviridae sp.]
MKLFAVKINDNLGSFAPIELLEQTKKDIDRVINLKAEEIQEDKREEQQELAKQLKKAKIIIIETKSMEEKNLYD